jgi:dGTPase
MADRAMRQSIGCSESMVPERRFDQRRAKGARAVSTWGELLNLGRRKADYAGVTASGSAAEARTEAERDYDRIMFSTPVRRLADKTQVFPLERNDSVRNRLTHSFEVSNLARSVGTTLAFNRDIAKDVPDSKRNIPAICAAIGLVHDLGNPPFGHQGEAAIQKWFADNPRILDGLTPQQRADFQRFEGNAQAFRLVTRLQLLNDGYGLDLSYATLAAMMKYPTASNALDKKVAAKKKHGFFYSEAEIAKTVLQKTGLTLGIRHPLAHVMEACDDIAYVVFDAEDAIKKGLASVSDLFACLKHEGGDDELIKSVLETSEEKHRKYRARGDLSPAELNDVSMQRFRVEAVGAMIRAVTSLFVEKEAELLSGSVSDPLISVSKAEKLRETLKNFSMKHAYTHKSVLCVELTGFNVITDLMDMLWCAVSDREESSDPQSKRNHPFTRLVYSRISENYRRAFENPIGDAAALPLRYRECQLVTDMIAGMTDSFAVELHRELFSLRGNFDPRAHLK